MKDLMYTEPQNTNLFLNKLPTAQVSPTPRCYSMPLGTGISSSGTTFILLQDVLFTHVQGVDI